VAVVVVVISCGDTGNAIDDDDSLMLEEETTDRVFPDERKRSATTQPFLIRNADPPVQLFVFVFVEAVATGGFIFAVATGTGIFVFVVVFATATGVSVLVVVRGGGGAIVLVSPFVPLFLLVLLLLALADDVIVDDGNDLSVSFPFCFSAEDLTGFGLFESTVGAIVKCDADMRFVAIVKWKRNNCYERCDSCEQRPDLD
jgi:hypothetical protein